MPNFVKRLCIPAASVAYGALLVVTRGPPTVGSDAGIFLSVAGRLLQGDRLYVDVLDNKDPLFFYTHAAALSVGDWRISFLLDIVWVAVAATSIVLLLQAVGATRLTAGVGFVCLPLLLTGTWYWPGFSMLAALSCVPLIGWLWLRRRFALAGALVCVGMLFKVNLGLVLISAPVAFLLVRSPAGPARSQVARSAVGFGAVAAVAAALLAVRGELHGYLQMLADNVAYSHNVLGATGRPTGILGHMRVAANAVGSLLHFAVVTAIFLAAGLLAVTALWRDETSGQGTREPSAVRLLAALFLVATLATSVTLALTAAWREHAQMLAVPGVLLIAFLVTVIREPPVSLPKTVSGYATGALALLLLGGAVGGGSGVRGSISSTWLQTGRSETADALERTAMSRLPSLKEVTFAHLGQNDERAVGAFLDSKFVLACPDIAQYVFTPDLSGVLNCIEDKRPRLILVTPLFHTNGDAPAAWNRFVAGGSSLLHRDYELVLDDQTDDIEVWELRTRDRRTSTT